MKQYNLRNSSRTIPKALWKDCQCIILPDEQGKIEAISNGVFLVKTDAFAGLTNGQVSMALQLPANCLGTSRLPNGTMAELFRMAGLFRTVKPIPGAKPIRFERTPIVVDNDPPVRLFQSENGAQWAMDVRFDKMFGQPNCVFAADGGRKAGILVERPNEAQELIMPARCRVKVTWARQDSWRRVAP